MGVKSLAQRLSPCSSKKSRQYRGNRRRGRAASNQTRLDMSRRRVQGSPAKGRNTLPKTWHEKQLNLSQNRGTCERGTASEHRLTGFLSHLGLVRGIAAWLGSRRHRASAAPAQTVLRRQQQTEQHCVSRKEPINAGDQSTVSTMRVSPFHHCSDAPGEQQQAHTTVELSLLKTTAGGCGRPHISATAGVRQRELRKP